MLITILLPLIAAIMIAAGGRAARVAWRLVPVLPLLLAWPLLAAGRYEPGWLLFGFTLRIDEVTAAFVVLLGLAWSLAGWQALRSIDHHQRTFWIGWLLCLSGMTLATFAADLVGFYQGYVVLSLSAWLMIVQARNDEAWRAGRIYLILALLGEAAILAGVLVLAGHYGNLELGLLTAGDAEQHHVIVRWLLLAGFGIKLGIIPLHLWLPLAHPAAPVPASAILSGVIVKAGLLGWLRLVPQTGLEGEPTGQLLLYLGLFTAFAGVALGLPQQRLKTVLAYSTISQMGLILAAFSLLFLTEEPELGLLSVIGLLVLHHGLNKAALFLACGNAPGMSRFRLLLFALPAVSLAAAPLTTGFLAKHWLKQGVHHLDGATLAYHLLTLTSAMTAMLMWKAWNMARTSNTDAATIHPAWPILVGFALVVPWAWAVLAELTIAITARALWDSAWPILLAAAVIVVHARGMRLRIRIPEGDAIVVFEALARRLRTPAPSLPGVESGRRAVRRLLIKADVPDRHLRDLPLAGLMILLVGGLLWVLMMVGGG
ncbi:complex I subunit 5 family protein [Wenzhouxiangella sp. AB-CW3]|uniref:complex I subunit 5 family protein n=1 Tax=Wenzhouxiangella sp. AB-CW3 TaxID=2771012 RepID=UPI001CC2CC04|nr:proton-conducting transporter membrane subunit [Wenzhouxiangella sp. AB-CW3]